MSSPSPAASNPVLDVITDGKVQDGKIQLTAWVKRHCTPYHFTVAAVLGGITAFFAVVIALLILVALNFNVLGWTE
jgi:hypothetical protein